MGRAEVFFTVKVKVTTSVPLARSVAYSAWLRRSSGGPLDQGYPPNAHSMQKLPTKAMLPPATGWVGMARVWVPAAGFTRSPPVAGCAITPWNAALKVARVHGGGKA